MFGTVSKTHRMIVNYVCTTVQVEDIKKSIWPNHRVTHADSESMELHSCSHFPISCWNLINCDAGDRN